MDRWATARHSVGRWLRSSTTSSPRCDRPRASTPTRRSRPRSATAADPTISATYVWQLRKGLRDNPTKNHIEALAGFFGVPPAYFFDEDTAAQIDAELELLAAIRDANVRSLALRAQGLSPESLDTIAEMIERVRKLRRPAGPETET